MLDSLYDRLAGTVGGRQVKYLKLTRVFLTVLSFMLRLRGEAGITILRSNFAVCRQKHIVLTAVG